MLTCYQAYQFHRRKRSLSSSFSSPRIDTVFGPYFLFAANGVIWDRDPAAIARRYFPEQVDSKTLPLEGSLETIKWRLDATETENVFGWKMTSFEETMKEVITQYLQLKKNIKSSSS